MLAAMSVLPLAIARSALLGLSLLATAPAQAQSAPVWMALSFEAARGQLAQAARSADAPARLLAQQAQLQLLTQYRRGDLLAPLLQTLGTDPAWRREPGPKELLARQAWLALISHSPAQAAATALPLRRLGVAELGPALHDEVQLLLASIDRELGLQAAALQRLDALLLDARRTGRSATQTRAWLARGALQVRLFDYSQGLKDYEQALRSAPDGAAHWQAIARMGLAQNLNMLNRRAEAYPLLAEALAHFERSGDLAAQADALLLQGFFLGKDERSAAAVAPLRQALALRESLGDARGVINALTHLCGRLLQAAQTAAALSECQRGLALSRQLPSAVQAWDLNGATAKVYARLGQFEAAYQHAHASERALLEWSKQQLADQTGALRAQLDLDLRRLDNERLAERLAFEARNRQRLLLLAGGLGLTVALLLASGVLLVRLYWRTRQLAEHDALTGLLNRRSLLTWADDELSRSQRHGLPLSFITMDLDHFKRVNDERGHAIGDRVLRELASCLLAGVRREDRLGRMGGEEFLLVLPHTGLEEASALAERLRVAVEQQLRLGPDWLLTLSLGVAAWQSGQDLNDCLQAADQALYRAKALGRNRVERAAPLTVGSAAPA